MFCLRVLTVKILESPRRQPTRCLPLLSFRYDRITVLLLDLFNNATSDTWVLLLLFLVNDSLQELLAITPRLMGNAIPYLSTFFNQAARRINPFGVVVPFPRLQRVHARWIVFSTMPSHKRLCRCSLYRRLTLFQ